MSNRLDQLFKDKLSHDAIAPSANAWERVKNGLAKKNSRPLVWRMAAIVVLVGALITTFFWLSSEHHVSNSSSLIKTDESKTYTAKLGTPVLPLTDAETQKTAKQPVSKKAGRMTTSIETDNANVHPAIEDQNDIALSSIRTTEPRQNLTPFDPVTAVASQQKEEKPIVLEYRLETIEPRHLVESAPAPESKAKSGLLKVIDFARDAKNADGRLGDLRQAKDELFAFNFKKDKPINHK